MAVFPGSSGGPEVAADGRMLAYRRGRVDQTAAPPRVRGVREDGRPLGAPPHLPAVWRDALLRQLPESPCQRACEEQPSSRDRLRGTGRTLAVLLSGRHGRRVLSCHVALG